MSRYNDIPTASFDDSYAMVKQMYDILITEGKMWEIPKYEVWVRAIRVTAEGLIDYYWRGTNPLGFSPRVVKASKTKIQELTKILDALETEI